MRVFKFLLFSCGAGIIETIVFTLLNELAGLPYWPSYLPALILSVVYNFTVNRRYTFKSVANVPKAMLKVLGYYCVFTPLSTLGGRWLTDAGWNDYLVLGLTMLVNLVTEFIFWRCAVFAGTIDTNDIARKKAAK